MLSEFDVVHGQGMYVGVLGWSSEEPGMIGLQGIDVSEEGELILADVYCFAPPEEQRVTTYTDIQFDQLQRHIGKRADVYIFSHDAVRPRSHGTIVIFEDGQPLKRISF